jgi:LacI family transcriptional regulator
MDQWTLPIGVFIDAEGTGRTITQMCHHRGWRVPQDVAIIAGYNEETLCEHPKPSLSSVDIGDERVGYEAAQLLDRLMSGQPPPKEPILVRPIGIVARESTDFLAVEDDLVCEALRFISAHSHRAIGVDEIAAAAATSRPTLERRFRKFLGRPIAAEIRRLRIERAKRELTSTDAPIRRIAQKTGFVDSTQFGRVFRREVGLSPSAYRRQYGS